MAATAAGTSVSRSAFFGTVATRNAVREKVAVGQAKVSMVGYLLHSLYMVSMVSSAWLGDVANMDLNFFCLWRRVLVNMNPAVSKYWGLFLWFFSTLLTERGLLVWAGSSQVLRPLLSTDTFIFEGRVSGRLWLGYRRLISGSRIIRQEPRPGGERYPENPSFFLL